MDYKPGYIGLFKTGRLQKRSRMAHESMDSCVLCPRKCMVNRLQGHLGFCRSGFLPKISSYNVHHGEEPPISGTRGSGTIFFSHCNLACCYCQNWPISQQGQGREVSCERLAGMMLELQERGCHNINLVTPSHMAAQILMALEIAIPHGFNLPLVYNTSGYDSLDTLKLLEGSVDIYMPDIRYTDPGAAERYSGAGNYPAVNKAALREMWRQVGELKVDDGGIAFKGMLVRHLVLPNGLSQTKDALKFLSTQISPHVHLSLMSQFFPAHKANQGNELGRPISQEEYRQALAWVEGYGLDNGWHQELDDTGGGPPDRIIKVS